MGRPRNLKPRRRVVGRRDFLRRSGAAMLAVAAVPVLQACGGGGGGAADPMPAPGATGFLHGVASGDPLSDAVLLWTRITPAGSGTVMVDFVVATDPQMTTVIKSGRVSTDA